jgi:predicted Zn finger-like uncharacterized protein
MKRITRCPSCATVYQLEDTHLFAAKGWLRCGACGHVFDSTGLVLRWAPVAASPRGVGDALTSSSVELPSHDRIVLDDLLLKEDRVASSEVQPAQSELASFEEALSTFKPAAAGLEPMPSVVSVSVPLRRHSVSRAGTYAAVGLALLLLFQAVYAQRHNIVAYWPESGPIMRHVCQSFGCEIHSLRDAERLVIESSSFIHRSEDHLLRWSVRNTSTRDLAMTALELSLLEGQDKVVLRRIFLPIQTSAPEILPAGQTWSGELKVSVDADLSFSDYRLLSFYP